MPSTAKGLRYPSGTDAPDVATDLQNLASDIDGFIGNTPLTTKGDILTYDTSETRLPVSVTDGLALTADSTQALGIKWAAPDFAGGWEKIGTVEIAAGAVLAQFTSISSYTHLRMHIAININGGSFAELLVQANGVTASTGYNCNIQVQTAAVSGVANSSVARLGDFVCPGPSATSLTNGWIEFDHADVALRPATRYMYHCQQSVTASNSRVVYGTGIGATSGAITSIQLRAAGASTFRASRATLYGLKAFGV